jgi:hypothetical protein
MRERVRVGSVFTIVATLLAGCSVGRANPQLSDPDFFCEYVKRVNARATWIQAREIEGLRPNDSILTCGGSTISLRSRLPYGSGIEWERDTDVYATTIPENTLDGLDSWKDAPISAGERVEILKVEGRVFYSRDFITYYGLIRGRMRRPPE